MSINFASLNVETGELVGVYLRRPMERERLPFFTEGESKTSQADKVHCDVNNIVAKFDRTGELPASSMAPQYGDVTSLQGDLTQMMADAAVVAEKVETEVKARRSKKRAEQLELQELGRQAKAAAEAAAAEVSQSDNEVK